MGNEASAATERIFYDGDCGVCHWAVSFVAHHDPSGRAFRFAPIGGETFERHVPTQIARDLPDSMIVETRDGRLLLRSRATLHILRRMGLWWRLVALFLFLVPVPIRDFAYDRFARIRHRLAARPDNSCPLMPMELRQRFDP